MLHLPGGGKGKYPVLQPSALELVFEMSLYVFTLHKLYEKFY